MSEEQCGQLCQSGGSHVLDLSVADCATREEHNCQLEGVIFAYAPSGYVRLSELLNEVIRGCAPGTVDFSVSLELSRGCSKRLSTSYEFSPGALACIRQKLESVRYACGEQVPCAAYAQYLL